MRTLFGSGLVRTELERVLRRRATRWLGVVLAIAVIAVWIGYTVSSQPASAAERAQSERYYRAAVDDWQRNGAQMIAECRSAQADARTTDPSADFGCDTMTPPKRSDYDTANPPSFDQLHGLATGFAGLAAAVLLVLAASLLGADVAGGTLGTQLLFVPGRVRVFAARGIAVLATAVVFALATIAIGLAGCAVILRGLAVDDASTHGDVSALVATGLRGVLVLVVIAVALTSFGLTWLVGHTGVTVGIAAAWLIAVELIVGAGSALGSLQQWLPARNLYAIATGSGRYAIETCTASSDGTSCTYAEHTFTLAHALGVWAVIVVGFLGAGLLWFRRRDVS